MDSSKVLEGLEQLDDDIDDLEESLDSLLKTALSDTTSKLPLLDRAKLYVLVTYAIESALFSYLRLNGVAAREHPVFTELTRVKQYFSKIKTAETPARPPNMALDVSAVGRFIKHGLAGNDKYDTEKAERIAKEKAMAHIRFTQMSKKRKAEDKDEEEESSSSESEPEFIGQGSTEEGLAGIEEVDEEEETNEVEVTNRKAAKEEKRARKKRKAGGDCPPEGNKTETMSLEERTKYEQQARDKNAQVNQAVVEMTERRLEKSRAKQLAHRERQAAMRETKKEKKAKRARGKSTKKADVSS